MRGLEGAHSLNTATGEYEDLVNAGVIDAAKVTSSALLNSASIATLFLTTDVVSANKPENEKPSYARRRRDGRLLSRPVPQEIQNIDLVW